MHDPLSVEVVRFLRETFTEHLLGVYRLYDPVERPAPEWRGVAILAASAPPTREVNLALKRFRKEQPAAWVRVYRLDEAGEIRERELASWFEFSLHASPVFVADDRAPKLLRAIRVRLAEGTWRRDSRTGAWSDRL